MENLRKVKHYPFNRVDDEEYQICVFHKWYFHSGEMGIHALLEVPDTGEVISVPVHQVRFIYPKHRAVNDLSSFTNPGQEE